MEPIRDRSSSKVTPAADIARTRRRPWAGRRTGPGRWVEGAIGVPGASSGLSRYVPSHQCRRQPPATIEGGVVMQVDAAVLRDAAGSYAIESVDVSDPGPGQVLVRVVAAGMCHTDVGPRHGPRARTWGSAVAARTSASAPGWPGRSCEPYSARSCTPCPGHVGRRARVRPGEFHPRRRPPARARALNERRQCLRSCGLQSPTRSRAGDEFSTRRPSNLVPPW